MRGLLSASLLLLLTLLIPGKARAEAFEGVIDLRLSMEAGSGDLKLAIAGQRSRLDMKLNVNPLPQPIQLSVLLDAKTPKHMWLVNDPQKTYSTVSLAAQAAPDTAIAEKYVLKVLGKEKILGYNCTHLTLTRHREFIDAWITQDLPDVYGVLRRLQEANPQFGDLSAFQALEAAGKAGLPMKMIVVRDGQRVNTEVKRIEKKKMPPTLFAVPADYKKTEGGMGGMQPTPEQIEQMKKLIQGALEGQ